MGIDVDLFRGEFKVQCGCTPIRIIAMAEPEDSVPWEVRLLQSYCDTESDLDAVSMSTCRIRSCFLYYNGPVHEIMIL